MALRPLPNIWESQRFVRRAYCSIVPAACRCPIRDRPKGEKCRHCAWRIFKESYLPERISHCGYTGPTISSYHTKDQECANCNRKLDHELVSTSLCLSLNAAGMLRLSLNSFELSPLRDDECRALPITLFLNGSLPRV